MGSTFAPCAGDLLVIQDNLARCCCSCTDCSLRRDTGNRAALRTGDKHGSYGDRVYHSGCNAGKDTFAARLGKYPAVLVFVVNLLFQPGGLLRRSGISKRRAPLFVPVQLGFIRIRVITLYRLKLFGRAEHFAKQVILTKCSAPHRRLILLRCWVSTFRQRHIKSGRCSQDITRRSESVIQFFRGGVYRHYSVLHEK